MSSNSREAPFSAGSTSRASMALRLVLFAVAASRASGFGVLPAPRTTTAATARATTAITTISKFNSPVSTRRRTGILARASADMAEKKIGEDDGGGSPALAVALAAAEGEAGATTSTAAATTTTAFGTIQVDGAFDPAAAAEKAAETRVRAVTRRAAKSVARPLPGTWWAAGLPKWMHVLRRRMITKEDWMHLHAASGTIFMVGSTFYMLYIMGMELIAGVPQLDTTSALPFCILGAGLLNSLSSIPMAKTRSWVLAGLCTTVIQLWFPWYVSGIYPATLAAADPWLAAASLTLLLIACVESEEEIQADRRTRELLVKSGKKHSGKIKMRGEDHVESDRVSRYGSLASLIFNVPHLYATLVGGGWVGRLAEAYPAAPALLFHSYFVLATSSSIALLGPTLYQRRLISVNQLYAMQLLTFAPMVTSLIDAAVMGSAATPNPMELYLGFLH